MRRDTKIEVFYGGTFAALATVAAVVVSASMRSWDPLILWGLVAFAIVVLSLLCVGVLAVAERIFKEDHRD